MNGWRIGVAMSPRWNPPKWRPLHQVPTVPLPHQFCQDTCECQVGPRFPHSKVHLGREPPKIQLFFVASSRLYSDPGPIACVTAFASQRNRDHRLGNWLASDSCFCSARPGGLLVPNAPLSVQQRARSKMMGQNARGSRTSSVSKGDHGRRGYHVTCRLWRRMQEPSSKGVK